MHDAKLYIFKICRQRQRRKYKKGGEGQLLIWEQHSARSWSCARRQGGARGGTASGPWSPTLARPPRGETPRRGWRRWWEGRLLGHSRGCCLRGWSSNGGGAGVPVQERTRIRQSIAFPLLAKLSQRWTELPRLSSPDISHTSVGRVWRRCRCCLADWQTGLIVPSAKIPQSLEFCDFSQAWEWQLRNVQETDSTLKWILFQTTVGLCRRESRRRWWSRREGRSQQ